MLYFKRWTVIAGVILKNLPVTVHNKCMLHVWFSIDSRCFVWHSWYLQAIKMILFASPSGNLTKPSKHFHDMATLRTLRFRYGRLHVALERFYRLSPLWRGKHGGSGRGGTPNNQETKKAKKQTEETNTQTHRHTNKKRNILASKQANSKSCSSFRSMKYHVSLGSFW